jgi:hypothetical protein
MSLKKAYLYLVSVISLVIAVVGAIMILNIALKTWIFTKADTLDYYYGTCASSKAPTLEGRMMECTPEEESKYEQEARDRRSSQKQRDAAQALAMIIVASPVWMYHWKMARREQ